MIKFIGEGIKITPRLLTGWQTFDHAFANRDGDIGFPVRAISEISGFEGVGKSTFALCLAGKIGKLIGSNIAYADIEEHLDRNFAAALLTNSEFAGHVNLVGGATDEEKLDALTEAFREEYSIGILDSIGAISPVSELQSESGAANWGRRAILIANRSRTFIHIFGQKETPSILLATNHLNPRMGGMGYETPGGQAIKFLSTTRIRLKSKEKFDDGSALLESKIIKNTFGYSGRVGFVFNLAGWGIHPGLTAVWDCILLGIAKHSRTVKLGDTSYGYMKNVIDKAEDLEMFEPFHAALEEYYGKNKENTGKE